MPNNTISEEDKLLVEIQNIDNHQGVPLKNRITANEMKQILELAKQYTLSKQIEARLDEAEEMWEKFDGYYADADRLCDYAVERIAELRKQQEEV